MLIFLSWTSELLKEKWGSGRRGNWRDRGIKREKNQHIYTMEAGCLLALSVTICLLADTRAVTLSCHGENKPADSVAELALTTLVCKRREDHMAALLCRSWVVPQDECLCLYFSHTFAKPGVHPHSHMTANRKWSIGSKCSNNMASPNWPSQFLIWRLYS